MAIVWIARASGSRDALQIVLAALWGIAAVTAWTGPQTEITAAGITWRLGPFSRRHVAWGDVTTVRSGNGLRLWPLEVQLSDGSTAGLPRVPPDHIQALRGYLTRSDLLR